MMDAIAEITTYGEYVAFSEKLKKLGFREDTLGPQKKVIGGARNVLGSAALTRLSPHR